MERGEGADSGWGAWLGLKGLTSSLASPSGSFSEREAGAFRRDATCGDLFDCCDPRREPHPTRASHLEAPRASGQHSFAEDKIDRMVISDEHCCEQGIPAVQKPNGLIDYSFVHTRYKQSLKNNGSAITLTDRIAQSQRSMRNMKSHLHVLEEEMKELLHGIGTLEQEVKTLERTNQRKAFSLDPEDAKFSRDRELEIEKKLRQIKDFRARLTETRHAYHAGKAGVICDEKVLYSNLADHEVSPGVEEEEAVKETQHSDVAVFAHHQGFAHHQNHGHRHKDALHPSSGHSAQPQHASHADKQRHGRVHNQHHSGSLQNLHPESSASSHFVETARLSKHA